MENYKGIPYWTMPHPCLVWKSTCWFSSLTCDFPHHFECLTQSLSPVLLNGLTSKYFISHSTLWINFSAFCAPDGSSGFRSLEALKNQWLYVQWLLHLSFCWMILVCASSFANHFRIPLGWKGREEYKISLAMVITFYLSNTFLPGSFMCLMDVISWILLTSLWGQEQILCYPEWQERKW